MRVMSSDLLQAKIAAQKSYTALLEQALQCATFYDRAQLAYPDELKMLFGREDSAAKNGHAPGKEGKPIFPQMLARPDIVPEGVNPEWVSIPVKKAIASSLVLACLRMNGGTVRVREIVDFVSAILPEIVKGTIANIGTRFVADGTVSRGDEGWVLLKREAAGVIVGDRYWAPSSVMQKQELATHRREAILHTLQTYKSGLQTVQIVERLREFEWVKAPVNKDLLKGDMDVLVVEGKVRHSGNSKKWILAGG
jgi:hypothetical protein